jgi:hypothetical protein
MKRALAERAKQSETTGHAPAQNGLGPQAPSVSSAQLQPPRKVPRVDGEISQPQIKPEPIKIPSQTSSSNALPHSSPSGTPRERRSSMKRQRSSAALAEEEEENNSSAFYLKHQNKALASELKGLQYQLRLLEKERDLRRQQCQEAGQALQALENTWTQMEVALQLGTPPERSNAAGVSDVSIMAANCLCNNVSHFVSCVTPHFSLPRRQRTQMLVMKVSVLEIPDQEIVWNLWALYLIRLLLSESPLFLLLPLVERKSMREWNMNCET